MYRYEKRESKAKKIIKTFVLIITVSATSIILYNTYLSMKTEGNVKNTEGQSTAIRLSNNKEQDKQDISATLEDVAKCIVGISKLKNNSDNVFEVNATKNLSIGTGTIISENGYIITNAHLAGNKYSTCYVTLEDGNIYNGNVVWADEDLDLAILKINANGLNYLEIGDSESIKIGEDVYAIGNPIGIELQRSVTKGIISGVNRTIKLEENNTESYMEGLIQTDASINQGNSGGPLINAKGEIIGINSVKIETAEGIGFAIPINIIKPVISKIIETGTFEEATIGIFAYDKEVIPYLDSNLKFENGIYVTQVNLDGPASKTGLKEGDIITKIDNIELNKMSELREYIYTKNPNDEVTLTILRNNKTMTLTVKLGKK